MIFRFYAVNPNTKRWGCETYYHYADFAQAVTACKKSGLIVYSDIDFDGQTNKRKCTTLMPEFKTYEINEEFSEEDYKSTF